MKPITLHPMSVLTGLALAGLAVVATGAAQAPVPTRTVFVGEVPAEWWTYVEVQSSSSPSPASYTVPPGKRFVVTTYEKSSADGLLADGQSADARLFGVRANPYGTIYQLGNGTRVVFEPGTLLTMPTGISRLWGYLEPVR
jgi:hypothetical protein